MLRTTSRLALAGGLSVFGMGCIADETPLELDVPDTADTGPRLPTDCHAADGLELWPIDNFELGAATNGYTNNEVCAKCSHLADEALRTCQALCRESQSPSALDRPLPAELIPDTRCGSRYALHVESQHFYQWGGLIGLPFAPALDAREYEGVAFWGRIRWGTRSTVRAGLLDPQTDATFIDPSTGEPRCQDNGTLDDLEDSCDPFGAFTVMTGDWQFFTVPFEEMRQRGFGHPARFIDLGALRRVSIEFGFGAWDVWIDDISLYRRAKGSP